MNIKQGLTVQEKSKKDFVWLVCFDKDVGHYKDSLYIAKIGGIHNETSQVFDSKEAASKHYSVFSPIVFTSIDKRDKHIDKMKKEGTWKE